MSLEELGELPLVRDGRSRFPAPCGSPSSPSPSPSPSSTSPAPTAKMVTVSPGPAAPVLVLVSSLAASTAATSLAHGGMGLGTAARVDEDLFLLGQQNRLGVQTGVRDGPRATRREWSRRRKDTGENCSPQDAAKTRERESTTRRGLQLSERRRWAQEPR